MSYEVKYLPVTKCFNITTGKLNSNAAIENGQFPFFTCAKELFHIDTFAFDQEALLLAGNNAQGQYDVKHYSGKFNAYQRTYVLTLANRDHSYDFYKYALQAQLEKLKHNSKGTNTKYITMEILERTLLPVPLPAEQKRIAAILDKADAIRRKRQQAINLADDFLRSVFLDMFGDPVTNPKGWEKIVLGDHIEHSNNGLSRRRKIEENVGDIVLRLQDVHYDGIRFDKELNRIILEEKEKSKFELNKGDLLFIRVNGNPDYVGRSAVFDSHEEPVYHNDHLIRLKMKDSFNSSFLSYTFNLPGGKIIISSKTKTSAGQHTISQGGIESLEFYLPPKKLQDEFVSIQKAVLLQVRKQLTSKNEADNGFNSLSQKAFAGEL